MILSRGRAAVAIVTGGAALLLLFRFPAPLFPHSIAGAHLDLRSDRPLPDAAVRRVLALAEAKLAAERGVFLEISMRKSHGLGNGHVAAMAKASGAKMCIDTDHHAPGDLMTPESRRRVALGAGLFEQDMARIDADMAALVQRLFMRPINA